MNFNRRNLLALFLAFGGFLSLSAMPEEQTMDEQEGSDQAITEGASAPIDNQEPVEPSADQQKALADIDALQKKIDAQKTKIDDQLNKIASSNDNSDY